MLVKLLASSRDESPATVAKALPVLFSYLSTLTKSTDAGRQDIGVQEYSSLLYGRASRQQFWKQRSETVAPLIEILQAAAGVKNGDASATLWSGATGSAGAGSSASASASSGGSTLGPSLGGGVGLQLLYKVLLAVWQLSFESADIGDDLNE